MILPGLDLVRNLELNCELIAFYVGYKRRDAFGIWGIPLLGVSNIPVRAQIHEAIEGRPINRYISYVILLGG